MEISRASGIEMKIKFQVRKNLSNALASSNCINDKSSPIIPVLFVCRGIVK